MVKKKQKSLFEKVKLGSKVTIKVPQGESIDWNEHKIVQEYKEGTGRCVMLFPAYAILNMGGPFGTPQVANADNILRVAGR